MKSIAINPFSACTLLMIALIPFSYFDPLGLRVIAFSGLLFVVMFVFSIKRPVCIDNGLLLFLAPLVMVCVFSFISGSKDFVSAAVFMSYLFLFNLLNDFQLNVIIKKSLILYLCGALFMAVGVVVQRILFEKFGYGVGKIDFYGGGRVGFGFLWMDYSFLSLYLLTALPLVFYLYERASVKIIISATLLIGSVVTTARTGLAALILTAAFVVALEFFKAIVKGVASRKMLLTISLFAVASFVAIYFYVEFSGREVRFDGSGRVEGYYLALQSFFDSPFLGVMFDREYFLANYGVIPHNLFIYIISQGGVFFFVLFSIWFAYVFYVAAFRIKVLRYPVVIASFGFMFIPSFFSAYFFALLVSLAMAEKRIFCDGVFKSEKKSISI